MNWKISVLLLAALLLQACTPTAESTPAMNGNPITPPTAVSMPTATLAISTLSEMATEDGTVTITEPFAATLTQVTGPYSGTLIGQDENVPNDCAGVDLENFVVEASFTNPSGVSIGSWDFGIFFRDLGENNQLRLIFFYEYWYLGEGIDDAYASDTAAYQSEDGSTNLYQLYVLEDTAYLYINGNRQAQMDVSTFRQSGDVCLAAWTYEGDPLFVTIRYDNFTVWSIDQAGS